MLLTIDDTVVLDVTWSFGLREICLTTKHSIKRTQVSSPKFVIILIERARSHYFVIVSTKSVKSS